MKQLPVTPESYQLLHQGAIALAQVEAAGIRIDVPYLERSIVEVGDRIKAMEGELREDAVYKLWRRRYGDRMKWDATGQLAKIVFGELGYKHQGWTASTEQREEEGERQYKSNDAAFANVDLPFVKTYFLARKLRKALQTYLRGIRREVVGDLLHASLNLHTVTTYRLSGSEPNLQNQPARNPEVTEIVRRCFIPRKDHVLLEIDYSAQEFRVAACFWKDPAMIAYASNPDSDIHRDQAMKLFMLERSQVEKKTARDWTKSKFVFAKLYGSYWRSMAANLWENVADKKFKVPDSGASFLKHLRHKGIKGLGETLRGMEPDQGTFERHVKQVEEEFERSFPVFSAGKEKWWQEYQKRGWFQLMTGFVVQWGKGERLSRNNLQNTPIQGPGAHTMLWSIIQLVKWFKKKRMRSLVVNSVHDSVQVDTHKDELQDVINQCKKIMSEDVRKFWDWVIVPLDVEIEVCEENWFHKKAWTNVGGIWQPK